eukprot:TRINITY_DN6799_c0_g1_i1.p1 TRINITY_DN6799_c0_g1~~TRINITY_DN6799_c0_g1_i1.p1  ORF type:complete len:128 (-),score=33.25 TRINITY_DN6799_c0_g1_i1:254-637(-)
MWSSLLINNSQSVPKPSQSIWHDPLTRTKETKSDPRDEILLQLNAQRTKLSHELLRISDFKPPRVFVGISAKTDFAPFDNDDPDDAELAAEVNRRRAVVEHGESTDEDFSSEEEAMAEYHLGFDASS